MERNGVIFGYSHSYLKHACRSDKVSSNRMDVKTALENTMLQKTLKSYNISQITQTEIVVSSQFQIKTPVTCILVLLLMYLHSFQAMTEKYEVFSLSIELNDPVGLRVDPRPFAHPANPRHPWGPKAVLHIWASSRRNFTPTRP